MSSSRMARPKKKKKIKEKKRIREQWRSASPSRQRSRKSRTGIGIFAISRDCPRGQSSFISRNTRIIREIFAANEISVTEGAIIAVSGT